jgi:nitrite reductase/ring-hydroxylating ferredoxin subunit
VQLPVLTHVATYRRRVAASTERVWENVRDWEHLPFLHGTSFRSIALEDSGHWGWRARIGLHPSAEIVVELCIEAEKSRYVSRTVRGPGAPSEIWTKLLPVEPDVTDIEVEFWLSDVAPDHVAARGAVYTQLYRTLWDEDEAMMVRRAHELARERTSAPAPARLALGTASEVRAKLPLCIEWAGRPFRIVEIDGELVVHATTCPHGLGPLDEAAVEDGAVTCPWHGWRFDLRSGRALDGRRARLDPPPRIDADSNGNLWLSDPRAI